MSYSHKEKVEICKKDGAFSGSYYKATVLAAIGLSKYLVCYETRFFEDRTRLLIESVDAGDIRPLPPATSYTNFQVSDRVDAYVKEGWWAGTVTRKVYPNYYVKLDSSGNEEQCRFNEVRIHLDWEDGKWVYKENRPQNDDNRPKTGNEGGTST